MKYRIIIIVTVALLLAVALLALVFGRKDGGGTPATLEFWGLDEPAVWSPIITAYQTQNPNITVSYFQKNPLTYEKELVNALASGAGPDIAYINNTWLNKHANKFSPLPGALMSVNIFQNSFMAVASQDLILSDQIYALPFFVDTLALYYNKSLFNSAGLVNPPKTWEEFNSAVKNLVQKNTDGSIGRAGAAVGNASNVNYAPDILGLLMLQTGARLISDEGGRKAIFDRAVSSNGQLVSPGLNALDFYTSFADSSKPVYTWNARLPNSLDAFVQGRSAMYLGYAHDFKNIQQKSSLNFGVAPIPQVKDSQKNSDYLDINFASYQAGAVTQKGLNKDIAWNFLIFSTSQNAAGSYMKNAYLPPARRDLVQFTASDPAMAVFAKQALSAASWPQPDDVEVSKIFNRMIDAVALGQSTSAEAIKEAAIEVNNLLK